MSFTAASPLFLHHSYAGHGLVDGKVALWLPAAEGEPPLFHIVHEDGDEEDLEEARGWFRNHLCRADADAQISIFSHHFRSFCSEISM